MKNVEAWRPTKFIVEKGKPKAYGKKIYPGSFILVSILARVYFEALSRHANGRLLDLGCGNVPLYSFYKDHVDEIICVDWENSFHENKFLDYQFDLNKTFTIDIGKFDTILSTDVLEHIEEPEVFFAQIKNSLVPGGKLILSTPFMYWIHEPPYDFNRYTEYKLKALCKKNNLEIIELNPYGGLIEVMADLVSKSLSNTRFLVRVFNKFMPKILNINAVRKYSKKHASTYPLGYLLVAQSPKE